MAVTQDDIDAILKWIVRDPHDDAPRLIYADMLEELGNGGQAEFIRVQIKLAVMVSQRPQVDPEDSLAAVFEALKQEDPEMELLQRKTYALFYPRQSLCNWQWYDEQVEVLSSVARVYGLKQPHFGVNDFDLNPSSFINCIYRRGFIDEVRCPLQVWLGSGHIVANSVPVTKWHINEIYYAQSALSRQFGSPLGGLYISKAAAPKAIIESNREQYKALVGTIIKHRRNGTHKNRHQAETFIKSYLAELVRPS